MVAGAAIGQACQAPRRQRAVKRRRAAQGRLHAERGTAYHEAGHAVVRLVCAALQPGTPKLKRATIVPNTERQTLGHVAEWTTPGFWQRLNAGELTDRMRLRLEADLLVLYAGAIAERVATGRWHHVGAGDDRRRAFGLALTASGDERIARAFCRWLDARAEALVHQHWSAIEAVATALLERKTLSASEVRAVARLG